MCNFKEVKFNLSLPVDRSGEFEFLKMKKYLLIFLTPFFLISCNSDNFYKTERYFTTDKNVYQIGDEFELTVVIIPEKEEKEIRFYKNFKNLAIWFEQIGEPIKNSFSKKTSEGMENTDIETFAITKTKPF